MLVLIFLLLISSPDARSSESVYPQNLAVTTGEPLSFFCGTLSNNETVIWKVRKMGSLQEDLISNGLNMTKVFTQSYLNNSFSSTGIYLLSKKYSTIDDAGTYRCIRTGRDQSVIGIGSAHLLVFGSKPECSANANSISEGKNLSLWCRMNYSGSLNPVTECSGIGVQVLSNIIDSTSVIVFKKQMSSIDNGKNVTCTVYFKPLISTDDGSDVQKAVNAPEYKYQWIYRTNILFGPKTIDIVPRKEAYLNDEVIRCVADGNPSPAYAWKENGSAVVVSEHSTLVVNEKTMPSRKYECTARNTRGSLSTSITIHILESDSNRGSGLIVIFTIVAGVFCIVVVVSIIVIAIKRMTETCRPSAITEVQSGAGNIVNEEDVHHLNVHVAEIQEDTVVCEYEDIYTNLHGSTIHQGDTTGKQEDGDMAVHASPASTLAIPETSIAYTALENRSAIQIPFVYESLEYYAGGSEVTNTQRNSIEALEKALYANVDQIQLAEYMNVSQIPVKAI